MCKSGSARVVVWTVVACAAACASAPRAPPQEEQKVAVGRVVGVSPVFDAFTVADESSGQRLRLEVESQSRLFYGEAPVAFSALEPGSIVRATYARTDEGWTALKVDVISHPGELDGTRDWSEERSPEGGRPGGDKGGR